MDAVSGLGSVWSRAWVSTSNRSVSCCSFCRSSPSMMKPARVATEQDAGLLTRCPSSRRKRPSIKASLATIASAREACPLPRAAEASQRSEGPLTNPSSLSPGSSREDPCIRPTRRRRLRRPDGSVRWGILDLPDPGSVQRRMGGRAAGAPASSRCRGRRRRAAALMSSTYRPARRIAPLAPRLWLRQDVRNPVVVELTVTRSEFDTAA